MTQPEQRSDEDLISSFLKGETAASAVLAQRYAPGIYDFAIRVTLDPEAADQATENTLNRIASELGKRPNGLRFHAWVYGIARDEALEALRERARGDGSRDESRPGALAPMDPRFLQTSGDLSRDAAGWAWGSARGQRPRDYSILDLLLRRQITPEEVADIASLSRNGVYGVIGRLRGGFEEAFVAAALYSSGRRVCSELAAIVNDAPSLAPAMRRDIGRHAESCTTCLATKETLPGAADVFTALLNVEIPDQLNDRLLPLMLAATPQAEAATDAASEAETDAEGKAKEDSDTSAPDVVARASAVAAAAGLAAAGAAAAGAAAPDASAEGAAETAAKAPPAEAEAPTQGSLLEADAADAATAEPAAEATVAADKAAPAGEAAAEMSEPGAEAHAVEATPETTETAVEASAATEAPAETEQTTTAKAAATTDAEVEAVGDSGAEAVTEPEPAAASEPPVAEPPPVEEAAATAAAATLADELVEAQTSTEPDVAAEAAVTAAASVQDYTPDGETAAAVAAVQDDTPDAETAADAAVQEDTPDGETAASAAVQDDTPDGETAASAAVQDDTPEGETEAAAAAMVEEPQEEPEAVTAAPRQRGGKLLMPSTAVTGAVLSAANGSRLAPPTSNGENGNGRGIAAIGAAGAAATAASSPTGPAASLGAASGAIGENSSPFPRRGGPFSREDSLANAGAGRFGAGRGEPPSGGPFARPTDFDDGGNKKKYLIYAVVALTSLVAIYVGVAVGDSLQSGGGGGGGSGSDLPTRTAGITEAACPGPINLNQGSRVALTFPAAPSGYELDENPGIRPVSPSAAVAQVEAISQQGNTVLFSANTVPNSNGRTDEYRITATFADDGDRQPQECTVRVVGPAGTPAAPTATQPAAATNTAVPATATRPPATQPPALPTFTAVPATATPDLSTPTSSVPTAVPTAGGQLISPTETPTTVPTPTVTRTPLAP